jgi:hypothetical protein
VASTVCSTSSLSPQPPSQMSFSKLIYTQILADIMLNYTSILTIGCMIMLCTIIFWRLTPNDDILRSIFSVKMNSFCCGEKKILLFKSCSLVKRNKICPSKKCSTSTENLHYTYVCHELWQGLCKKITSETDTVKVIFLWINLASLWRMGWIPRCVASFISAWLSFIP